jgi:putative polyhydroxyalkanoate system protein
MADIDIRRAHDMGMKEARAAAEKMAAHLGKKFGLQGDWDGDTLHFDRPGVQGSLHLTPGHLALSVKLGFMLKMMRGSIEQAVVGELDKLFAEHRKAPAAKAPSARSGAEATAKKPAGRKKSSP